MVIGILLAFLAYAVFATGDALIRSLGTGMPVFEVVFFTTLFASIVVPFAKPREESWRNAFEIRQPKLLALRAASGIVAGICGVLAFTNLPLADAYALIFLLPLVVTVFSIVFLGETVRWRRWMAIAIGLVGVLIVIRPGFREVHIGHLAAFGVAIAGATTMIVLRKIGNTESRIALIGSVMVAALLVNGLLMIPGFQTPTQSEMLRMAAAGLCGGIGHLLIMAATRRAPASQVAPCQYSQAIWAVVFGVAFFAEVPDPFTIAGTGLVVVSGLITLMRERALGVPIPAPPDGRER